MAVKDNVHLSCSIVLSETDGASKEQYRSSKHKPEGFYIQNDSLVVLDMAAGVLCILFLINYINQNVRW